MKPRPIRASVALLTILTLSACGSTSGELRSAPERPCAGAVVICSDFNAPTLRWPDDRLRSCRCGSLADISL